MLQLKQFTLVVYFIDKGNQLQGYRSYCVTNNESIHISCPFFPDLGMFDNKMMLIV